MIDFDDKVKIRLLVLVENVKHHLESRIDEKLLNNVKSIKLTNGQMKRVIRLAYALGIIDKTIHDNLVFLNMRRNEAAHIDEIKLSFADFPNLDKMLDGEKSKELRTIKGDRWSHYTNILDAIEEHILATT